MADTAYQPTPWVDTLIEERNLLDGLAGLCLNNGWTKVAEFTKVAYWNQLTKPTVKRFYLPLGNPMVEIPKPLNEDYYIYLDGEEMPTSYYTVKEEDDKLQFTFDAGVVGMAAIYYSSLETTATFDFYVAKHYVVKNISGNIFGMAQLAKITANLSDTEHRVPFAIPNKDEPYGTKLSPQDEGMFSWAVQKAEEEGLYERSALYFYQVEKWIGNGRMHTAGETREAKDLTRLALDVEMQTSMWDLLESTGSLKFNVSDKYPQMYQSPIVRAYTRVPQLESIETLMGVDVKFTNWWDDSKVLVKGFIDGASLMLILLADTAPVWEQNAVPAIPIYMGDFETGEQTSETSNRDITFDFMRATTRTSTIVTSKPMSNAGSYVRVWLMGDVNGDFAEETVTLRVAGEEIGVFNTSVDTVPTNNKADAEYMGQFDITGIQGKSSITIEAVSGAGVGGAGDYTPVGARMFLEVFLSTDEEEGEKPAALFAGTALSKERASAEAALVASGNFDFDDVSLKQDVILPVMKDYKEYPSNGVDSVMVKRTKYGARYQAHYLAWALPPNLMPPTRQDADEHKYPRAWNRYDNAAYHYQFNPSRYSEKAHSSRAMLIHPENGKFGTLRNVILVSPLTIMNGDELQAVKDNCAPEEGKYQTFSYYLVEGISPLTKRPATAFRPAGLGILREGFDLPDIPPPPPAPPDFIVNISPAYSTVEEGESVLFTSLYSKHSPLTNTKWAASSSVHRGSYSPDEAQFTFQTTGTYQVTFTAWNEEGQTGTATATVVVNAKPVPPPPPPPPPPPNTLQCGQLNDSGGGSYTEKFHEMGTTTGRVKIDYDMYGIPDRMDVYYMNQLLASTSGEVANKGSLTFSYQPVNGVTQIKVVLTSSNGGGSSWEYMVNCPA